MKVLALILILVGAWFVVFLRPLKPPILNVPLGVIVMGVGVMLFEKDRIKAHP